MLGVPEHSFEVRDSRVLSSLTTILEAFEGRLISGGEARQRVRNVSTTGSQFFTHSFSAVGTGRIVEEPLQRCH